MALGSVATATGRARWAALLAALMVILALTTAETVLAHAALARSDPAAGSALAVPPSELRLWFTEAPEPRFTQVRILDSSGDPVQGVGPLSIDPSDPELLHASLRPFSPGTYTVTWRTTSAVDGHVASGSFAFAVGAVRQAIEPSAGTGDDPAGAGPTQGEVAIRWLGYLGMSLLVGSIAFLTLVTGPIPEEHLPDDADSSSRHIRSMIHLSPRPTDLAAPASSRLLVASREVPRLALYGWVLTLLTTVAAAVAQAASSAGVSLLAAIGSPLATLLVDTRYGALAWVRLALLASLLVMLAMASASRQPGQARGALWPAALLLSLGVLLTTSLTSHAPTGPKPVVDVIADWVHLSAAGVWIGGLAALALVLRAIAGAGSKAPHYLPGVLVARFSLLATGCVVALGATGLLRASTELSSWQDLLDTPYGNVLLAKLSLLVPLLGLAALNRFLVQRRMNQAVGSGGRKVAAGSPLGLLRNAVGGEVLLTSAVLLATSILAALPPSVEAFGPALVVRDQEDGIRGVLAISPGQAGPNSFDVYLRNDLLQPVEGAEKVALIFLSTDMPEMGEIEAVAADQGGGHYRVQGDYLSMESGWRIDLLVRRPGKDDVRLHLAVEASQLSKDHQP